MLVIVNVAIEFGLGDLEIWFDGVSFLGLVPAPVWWGGLSYLASYRRPGFVPVVPFVDAGMVRTELARRSKMVVILLRLIPSNLSNRFL